MNAEEAVRRVAAARVGRLATVGTDGRPHVVPCCFALGDDVVYSAVDAKPKSTRELKRVANIRATPAVSLVVDHYDDDDWSALWWVRIDGEAAVVDSDRDEAAALELLVAKYQQYRGDPPAGPFLAVTGLRWRSWKATPR